MLWVTPVSPIRRNIEIGSIWRHRLKLDFFYEIVAYFDTGIVVYKAIDSDVKQVMDDKTWLGNYELVNDSDFYIF